MYPNDKCYFIPGDDHFLLALLNSTLALFYLRHIVAKLEGGSPDDTYYEFRAQYMERLPVWRSDSESEAAASAMLSGWLKALYGDGLWRAGLVEEAPEEESLKDLVGPLAEAIGREPVLPSAEAAGVGNPPAPFAPIVAQIDDWLADDLSAAERAVEDFLAHLARTMSDLHERRLGEVDKFLSWLEEQLGCPVDELTGKTYVRTYYEQPEGVDKLLETIERNRPSSTDLDVRRPEEYGETNPDRERIVSGYRRSMDTLGPVLQQLTLTDALIDQLVYRLYDLTDEEVRVVEEYVG